MAQNKRNGTAQTAAPDRDGFPGPDDQTQPGAALPARPVDAAVRPEPRVRRQRPVLGLGDSAAARLLLSDDLPADERPRPDDRVLLVGLVWGNTTLIELEQIARGADLPAGRLFDLPAAQMAKDFRIVRHLGNDHVLTLPAEVATEVHRGGAVTSLQQLTTAQKARLIEAPFRGYALPVENDDRIAAQVAPQLTLIARYVRAAPAPDKPLLERLDIPFASTVILALLALGLFFLMVSITPRVEEGSEGDLTRKEQAITQYQVRPEPRVEQPRFKDLAGLKEGEKAREKEGKLGKEDAPKKDAAPSKKGAPVVDKDKKETDRKKVMKLGLVAALSKMGAGGGSAASNVLGPGGLGSGINNALGGVKSGAGAGDAYGVGGMGTRGSGAGGGGKALGIGGLGTRGGGSGRGGYGAIDLGGRGKDETVFVPGRTTVVGGLSREVINRVIQKHYNEIKYCYEKELTHDPGLYGKITVLFVIAGDGRVGDALVQQTTMSSEPVESCMLNHVKRWTFPAPQGGGTVQVTYPYVFKSSGQ